MLSNRPCTNGGLSIAAAWCTIPTGALKADSTGRRNTPFLGGDDGYRKTQIRTLDAAQIVLARTAACLAA
jgi:hypothetical protein